MLEFALLSLIAAVLIKHQVEYHLEHHSNWQSGADTCIHTHTQDYSLGQEVTIRVNHPAPAMPAL